MFPRLSAELARADEAIETLSVRAPSVQTLVDELSGGNAQKTVFAKWLRGSVRVLLLDEPTAGIDIGAKRDIQQLIREFASRGMAVIIVDSEFGELLATADRVLVVRHGRIVGERRAEDTSEMELVALASGLAT